MTYKKIFKIIFEFIKSSIPTIFNSIMIALPNFLAISKMSYFEDEIFQASMGWIIQAHYFFFLVPSTGNYEVLGIKISKYFGSNDVKNTRTYFYKGIFFQTIINIISIFFFLSVYNIFYSLGFDKTMSYMAYVVLKKLIIVIILQGYNEMLRNFLISCNIYYQFIYLNFLSFIVFYFVLEYYLFKVSNPLFSFVYAKIIQELFNSIIMAIMMIKYLKLEYYNIKLVKVKEIFFEINLYFKSLIKIVIGFLSSLLMFQINTIYIGMLKDIKGAAAWFCMGNLGEITFLLGLGFSVNARTKIGHIIGDGNNKKAFKYCLIYLIFMLCFGFLYGFTIFIFREQISSIFASGEVKILFKKILIMYSMISVVDSCNYFYGGLIRIFNKENELMKVYISVGIIFNSILGYILCFVLNLRVIGNVLSFMISYFILFAFLNYLYFYKIHNKIYPIKKDNDIEWELVDNN